MFLFCNFVFYFFLDIKAEKRRKSEEVDPMDPSSYSDAPRYFSINQVTRVAVCVTRRAGGGGRAVNVRGVITHSLYSHGNPP